MMSANGLAGGEGRRSRCHARRLTNGRVRKECTAALQRDLGCPIHAANCCLGSPPATAENL